MCESAYQLRASMYVPCDHPKLTATLKGERFPGIRSLVACTEDAVSLARLDYALEQLGDTLRRMPQRGEGPRRFIRCRRPDVLEQILDMEGIERVDGFVLPKAEISRLRQYEALLTGLDFQVMPTLETCGVFDPGWRAEMRDYLSGSSLRVLALRIGGNDLLRLLGMRRTRGITIYETPLGVLIPQLMLEFRPSGFHLTAPVYDYFEDLETLAREVMQDAAYGLVGKTAIHPMQAPVIEKGWALSAEDVEVARQILEGRDNQAAVFASNGAMHEVLVHDEWAEAVLQRARSAGSGQ
jgi:citrate lyase beta subunit